jgi:hypothetical protein
MHVHLSAIHLVGVFLGVLMIGTLWRLASAHLAASTNPYLQLAGRIGAFQY